MKGGKRAGSGVKPGMKNAAKPAAARREIDKSVSYSAAEWELVEAALIATGKTHSAFARLATVTAATQMRNIVEVSISEDSTVLVYREDWERPAWREGFLQKFPDVDAAEIDAAFAEVTP